MAGQRRGGCRAARDGAGSSRLLPGRSGRAVAARARRSLRRRRSAGRRTALPHRRRQRPAGGAARGAARRSPSPLDRARRRLSPGARRAGERQDRPPGVAPAGRLPGVCAARDRAAAAPDHAGAAGAAARRLRVPEVRTRHEDAAAVLHPLLEEAGRSQPTGLRCRGAPCGTRTKNRPARRAF